MKLAEMVIKQRKREDEPYVPDSLSLFKDSS